MKNDFKPVVVTASIFAETGRRAGLRGPRHRAEQNAVLHVEFCARRCAYNLKSVVIFTLTNAHDHLRMRFSLYRLLASPA